MQKRSILFLIFINNTKLSCVAEMNAPSADDVWFSWITFSSKPLDYSILVQSNSGLVKQFNCQLTWKEQIDGILRRMIINVVSKNLRLILIHACLAS